MEMAGQPHVPAVFTHKVEFPVPLNRRKGSSKSWSGNSGISLDPAEIPTPHFPERSPVVIVTILA